ncbi:hypothetical protein BC833DRAFT_573073 [Globomyces pollinis-pini]|nr:hypothetical protein BC833DRAFT_573073 [Globomyces pollinis-pini]KAJ2997587.1 hypothetical protein HDV02_005399 [Globomyces sp. JEL0801]
MASFITDKELHSQIEVLCGACDLLAQAFKYSNSHAIGSEFDNLGIEIRKSFNGQKLGLMAKVNSNQLLKTLIQLHTNTFQNSYKILLKSLASNKNSKQVFDETLLPPVPTSSNDPGRTFDASTGTPKQPVQTPIDSPKTQSKKPKDGDKKGKVSFASVDSPMVTVRGNTENGNTDKENQDPEAQSEYLGKMYEDILLSRDSSIRDVKVKTVPQNSLNGLSPQVFFPIEADLQSQAASVVDSEASSFVEEEERVVALYDFEARSEREMSFKKGDIIIVRKRQGTWIFGKIVKANRSISDQSRFRRGPPQSSSSQTNVVAGWVPVAFVTKFTKH